MRKKIFIFGVFSIVVMMCIGCGNGNNPISQKANLASDLID